MPGASVRGDSRQLGQLIAGLRQLASPGFRRELNRQLGEEALSLTQQGFESGTSPYGDRWAPPKRRQGQPLRDTGRLMNSFKLSSTASGFVIRSDVVYAAIHQYGGAAIPRRQYLPDHEDVGPRWRAALSRVAVTMCRAAMGG